MTDREDQKDKTPQGLSWGSGGAATARSEPPSGEGRDVRGVFGKEAVTPRPSGEPIKADDTAVRKAPAAPRTTLSSAPPKGSFLPKADPVDSLFAGDKAAPQPAVRTEESTMAVLGSWAGTQPASGDPGHAPKPPAPAGVAGAFSLSSLKGEGPRHPLAGTMIGLQPPPAMSAAPPPAGAVAGVPGPPSPAGAANAEGDEGEGARLLIAEEAPPFPDEEITVAAAPSYPKGDGSLSDVLPEDPGALMAADGPLLAPPPPVDLPSVAPEAEAAPPPSKAKDTVMGLVGRAEGAPPDAHHPTDDAGDRPSKLDVTLVGNGPAPAELDELFAAAGLRREPEPATAKLPGADTPRKSQPHPATAATAPRRRGLSFTQRALLLGTLAGLLGGGLIAMLRHRQAAPPEVIAAPPAPPASEAVAPAPQPSAAPAPLRPGPSTPAALPSPTASPLPAEPNQPPVPPPAAAPLARAPAPKEAAPQEGMSDRERLKRAEQLLDEGDAAGAEAIARDLLMRDPREHHVMEALTRALLDQGKGREAVDYAKRIVRRRQKRASYRLLLGDALNMTGDTAAAQKEYRTALELDPGNVRAKQRVR